MSNSRITWDIQEWRGRYRAEMRVDGHRVNKAYFDTYTQAQEWCYQQRDLLKQEVREF